MCKWCEDEDFLCGIVCYVSTPDSTYDVPVLCCPVCGRKLSVESDEDQTNDVDSSKNNTICEATDLIISAIDYLTVSTSSFIGTMAANTIVEMLIKARGLIRGSDGK